MSPYLFRFGTFIIPAMLFATSDIIIGTFAVKSNAYDQNRSICERLRSESALLSSGAKNSFRCSVKRFDGYYCPVLTEIGSSALQRELFVAVKGMIPDAYLAEGGLMPQSIALKPEPSVKQKPKPVSNTPPSVKPVKQPPVTTVPKQPATPVPSKPAAEEPSPFLNYLLYTGIALLLILTALWRLRTSRKKPAEALTPLHATEPGETISGPERPPLPETEPESKQAIEAVESGVSANPSDIFETFDTEESVTFEDNTSLNDFFDEEDIFSPVDTTEAPEPFSRKKREKPDRNVPVTKADLSDFRTNRILIAEDSLINQKVIGALFDDSGVEIIMADNGQKAIDILENDPDFNMILMDAHMPVKDGFEASREIRANPAFEHTVIVALSGDVGSDDLRKMSEAGMEEQLAKPLDINALYDVLYQYLDLPDTDETALNDDAVLDIETGLDICGDDPDFYREMLDAFVTLYKNSAHVIEKNIGNEHAGQAAGLLFDIIGVAGNIGAHELKTSAEALRQAMLDSGQSRTLDKPIAHYKQALKHLLHRIETASF